MNEDKVKRCIELDSQIKEIKKLEKELNNL